MRVRNKHLVSDERTVCRLETVKSEQNQHLASNRPDMLRLSQHEGWQGELCRQK